MHPTLYKTPLGSRANSSAEERRPYKAVVAGSNPASPTENLLVPGAVVKLVITPACHAGGRGFKSRPLRDSTEKNRKVLLRWRFRITADRSRRPTPYARRPATRQGSRAFIDV